IIVEPLPEEQSSLTPKVNAPLQEPNVSQEQDKPAATEAPPAPIKAPESKPDAKPNDGAEPQPKIETEGIK
ncbi:hypothetical protein ACXM5X_34040, partial [Pseudomonas saponiphila]